MTSCSCWRYVFIVNHKSIFFADFLCNLLFQLLLFLVKHFICLVFFFNLTTNIEIKNMHFTGKLNLPHIKRTKTRKKKKTATGSLWYKNVAWFPWFEWYSSSFVGKIHVHIYCLARSHYQKAVGGPISRFNPATCVPVSSQDLDYQRHILWYILHSIMWSERWLIIL